MKIELCRDYMSEKLDLYELKMALFDDVKPERFFLFMRNFKMTIDASGMLTANSKLRYLRTILCVEALHQFDTLCAQVGSTTLSNLNRVILV